MMVKITTTNSLGHGSVMFFHHGQNHGSHRVRRRGIFAVLWRGSQAGCEKTAWVCGTMTAEPWCFADLSTIINHE